MTYLFLIRHGENDYLRKGILIGNTPGIHLNEQGRNESKAIAQYLKNRPLKAIYSSPLERAVETAAPLADCLNVKIIIRPDLTDTNVGTWAGEKISLLRKLIAWEQIQNHPSKHMFPGGDSFMDLQLRLVTAIDDIVHQFKNNDQVAIFFHADPIKLIIASFLGMPLDNFQRICVDTGSISMIVVAGKEKHLSSLNFKPPIM